MINIGVVGCGHWGPNHIRVFNQLANSQVKICADLDENRLSAIKALFPEMQVTKDYQDILKIFCHSWSIVNNMRILSN